MMERGWWLLFVAGVGWAQVNTPLTERFFLPIASYRLASTATLLEGDLDRLLDPAMAGTVEGQRIYTSLSDLFLQEQLFNNVSLGRWVLAGSGPLTGFGRPVGLAIYRNTRTPLLTTRGLPGEYTLDSLHYYSTLGPGNPPDRREEIRMKEETYDFFRERALMAGIAQNTGGLYLLHQSNVQRTIPTGTELTPFGQFSFSYELFDHPSGSLLYSRSIEGQAESAFQTDLWAVLGGYRFRPDLRLTAGLALFNEAVLDTAQYSGMENLSPGGPLNRVIRSGIRRDDRPTSGTGLLGELRMDRKGKRWEGTGRLGVFMRKGNLREGQTLLDTLWSQEELFVDTAINRVHFTADTALSGKQSVMGVYAGWSQRYRYDRGIFATGVGVEYIRTEETTDLTYTETTTQRVTDGDGVPQDPDDFTAVTRYSETRKHSRTVEVSRLHLPVALEVRPHHQAPLLLRLGGLYTLQYTREVFGDEGLSASPRTVEIVTDAGDTTLQNTPVDLASVQQVTRSLTSTLQFSYGAAVPVGQHFLFEVMGFATLTDLRGWRVSVTWIP